MALYLRTILAWAVAHPEAALAASAALVALLRALYALVSRVVAPYPRLRAAVEALAALGPDVLRAVLQLARAITGRPLPSLDLDARDAEIASLRAQVARLQGPEPPAGQRGYARVGVLALVAAIALGIPLGLVLQGCGPARETVMRAAPGVPEVSGCAANTQRCNANVPEVCSSSGRWWPSLPVRPDGTQRACVSCVVEDGVAGCAL